MSLEVTKVDVYRILNEVRIISSALQRLTIETLKKTEDKDDYMNAELNSWEKLNTAHPIYSKAVMLRLAKEILKEDPSFKNAVESWEDEIVKWKDYVNDPEMITYLNKKYGEEFLPYLNDMIKSAQEYTPRAKSENS